MESNWYDKFSLKGKIAWVTGASSGMGFAIAVQLAKAGAKVAFNCRDARHLAQALADYEAAGVKVRGFLGDTSKEEDVQRLVSDIENGLGRVDILVNNAGIIKRVPMAEMSAADFRQVIDVDLIACFMTAKAVLRGMIAQRSGKIINMCSILSELGRDTVAAYTAAKGGLKMLTRNIATEYGKYNIQCNGIGPGFIATPFTEELRRPLENGKRNPFDSLMISKTPAGRWGVPEDITGPALFLASAASDFVNGQILYVDGGLLASFGHYPED